MQSVVHMLASFLYVLILMQYFIFQHFFSNFFLLYKKCWIQYVCFHESVGFCNFIDESVLISIGLIVNDYIIISAFSKQNKKSSFSLTVF